MKVVANQNITSVSGLFEDKLQGEVFDIKDQELANELIKNGYVSAIEEKKK